MGSRVGAEPAGWVLWVSGKAYLGTWNIQLQYQNTSRKEKRRPVRMCGGGGLFPSDAVFSGGAPTHHRGHQATLEGPRDVHASCGRKPLVCASTKLSVTYSVRGHGEGGRLHNWRLVSPGSRTTESREEREKSGVGNTLKRSMTGSCWLAGWPSSWLWLASMPTKWETEGETGSSTIEQVCHARPILRREAGRLRQSGRFGWFAFVQHYTYLLISHGQYPFYPAQVRKAKRGCRLLFSQSLARRVQWWSSYTA